MYLVADSWHEARGPRLKRVFSPCCNSLPGHCGFRQRRFALLGEDQSQEGRIAAAACYLQARLDTQCKNKRNHEILHEYRQAESLQGLVQLTRAPILRGYETGLATGKLFQVRLGAKQLGQPVLLRKPAAPLCHDVRSDPLLHGALLALR